MINIKRYVSPVIVPGEMTSYILTLSPKQLFALRILGVFTPEQLDSAMSNALASVGGPLSVTDGNPELLADVAKDIREATEQHLSTLKAENGIL